MEDDLSLDWDQANIDHIGRHGVVPGEVSELFTNEAIDLRYEVVDGEERWTSIGHTNRLRILVMVWTMRGELVRPVTAFEAGRQLAADYLAEKGR
jgi:uncharacterized DUF497 family protein